MTLSAPIYRLKREARRLARELEIPLHQALDRVARREGYARWSLLVASAATRPATLLRNALHPGDLVLLGARPRQGKTLTALELLARTVSNGQSGAFFTLEYTERETQARLEALDINTREHRDQILIDTSDDISAEHVAARLQSARQGGVAVIDYLQLLDQQRSNPGLPEQIAALKLLARRSSMIVVCLSQIDRRFENSGRRMPEVTDVRLPNPLDLGLFDKTCFLNDGRVRIDEPG